MKVICIGAGAAGLFFALNASSKGVEVLVLDSNSKPGRKLAITGKGRCNITNKKLPREFLDHVVRNNNFLYSSLNAFTPFDTMEFFESHGCPLKVERGDRVFPVSDKSSDIIDTLVNECLAKNVVFKYNEQVEKVEKVDENFIVKTKSNTYVCDKLVIATGGASYTSTGSKGDGYKFAKSFNHKITEIKPSLCPIVIEEYIPKEMFDFTLKNVEITAKSKNFKKKIFGDLEFLNNRLTGPIILTLSTLINRIEDDIELSLDFKPALNNEKLNNRILREINNAPNNDVLYLLTKLLPNEIIKFFISHIDLDVKTKLNSFTKEDRNKLVKYLKEFKFTFISLDDLDRAVVTSGGVNVNEINQKSMESKIVKGLYFIGEVLDVDAQTGGYSLQIALSTAYVASKNITK